jgi:uncharacterized protein YcbK (DUF882 family)
MQQQTADPHLTRRLEFRARSAGVLTIAATLLGLWFGPASALHAEREHTVGKGQTLARIAAHYEVPVVTLAAANGLARSATLREGQVLLVPARGVVYVGLGDTLAAIARRHGVTVAELARLNQLGDGAQVRAGQRLRLPGFDAAPTQTAAEQRWGKPRQRGMATLHRLSTHVTRRVRLVDDRGRVRHPALHQVGLLLRPRDSRRVKEPHPRLVRLLARVSDHFGGRPIHIVSGYRRPGGNTRESSRHVAAQAIDFRIPGVALSVLRDYCARLENVGVGYYPHSNFVHLDVRRRNARWTDLSGPGEPARIERAHPVAVERSPDGVTRASQPAAIEPHDDEPVAADEGLPPAVEALDSKAGEPDATRP